MVKLLARIIRPIGFTVLLSALLSACNWPFSEQAMLRKFLTHEQKFAEIVEAFNHDEKLFGIKPGMIYAEQHGLSTPQAVFYRQLEILESLDIGWAKRSGRGIEFFNDNSISVAYGYYYFGSSSDRLPSLPDLNYSTVSAQGYGTYYKHIKGQWYLYAEYIEW